MMREGLTEKSFVVKLSKFIEKISTITANEHITIHDIAVKLLESRNKAKFHSVMNGVDTSELMGLQKIHTEDFNIVYHGAISENLNLISIVNALSRLREKISAEEFKSVKFLLYGSGECLSEILEKAQKLNLQNNVIHKGRLEHDDMLRELIKASVSVYPPLRNIYTEICYPIKLTELIGLKVPIIASRYTTICYYYPEDCFFYFDAGDLDGLVEQILIVKNNPDLVLNKAENAKKAYEKVSWSDVMKPRYLKIISDMQR
jgi:glycosyltransferase involved in cell wall biosynthesis